MSDIRSDLTTLSPDGLWYGGLEVADVQRVAIYSRWLGLGSPPYVAARLILDREETNFSRRRSPEELFDQVSSELVQELLTAAGRPALDIPDFTRIGVSDPEVLRSYCGRWTDDYPSMLIEIRMADGRQLTLETESQHVFMLPFALFDGCNELYKTFDPRLSLAIAALMPDGFLERDRLAGIQHWVPSSSNEVPTTDSIESPPTVMSLPHPEESTVNDRDTAMHQNAETPSCEQTDEQMVDEDRAWKISRRLLRRLSVEKLKEVLAQGGDPSVAGDAGVTALMHASFPPFDEVQFELLAEAGADLEARRHGGWAGLHLACGGGDDRVVLAWVKAGADIHSRTPSGSTPLMLGASWCRIVHLLLIAGANPNDVDSDGHSALSYAVMKQNEVDPERQQESIRALIAAGTFLNTRDKAGRTVLGHARNVVARIEMESDVDRAFGRMAEPATPVGIELAHTIVRMLEDAGGAI